MLDVVGARFTPSSAAEVHGPRLPASVMAVMRMYCMFWFEKPTCFLDGSSMKVPVATWVQAALLVLTSILYCEVVSISFEKGA